MNDNEEPLNCILLPLFDEQYLLLPRTSLVEIIKSEDLDIVVDSQGGLIGKIQWHGWNIPLISFEAASTDSIPKFNTETRTALIHSLSEDDRMPYIGFTIQDEPISVRYASAHLESQANNSGSSMIQAAVKAEDKMAFIPDLEEVIAYVNNKL